MSGPHLMRQTRRQEEVVTKNCHLFFTVVPCILILSKFYYQLMHKRDALKGVLKFTLKQFQHVSV